MVIPHAVNQCDAHILLQIFRLYLSIVASGPYTGNSFVRIPDRFRLVPNTFKFLCSIAAVALSLSISPARAQSYPTQPIRLIVPFAPGGGMESTVRTVVQRINESGWPMIVDNRPGGAGTIAALATKQAPPDGYTLMLIALSTHAINVSLIPDLKYDPVKDFSPITVLFSYPSVVAVPANSPAKSLADLVALAKSKPGGINYGSPGTGTVAHILGLMFQRAAKVHMVHVPYRGGGPAMLDLLAGRLDFMIFNPSGIIPNVESGQLRLLAVTSRSRFSELPDVPTMTELGYPDVYLDGWFGVGGPAELPDETVRALHGKFASVLNSPDLNRRLKEQGWVVDPITPDAFRRLIESDIVRLGQLLKDTGAKFGEGPQ
jgi:tripartite-type tricarboxylate transporter receptor subunit TctC